MPVKWLLDRRNSFKAVNVPKNEGTVEINLLSCSKRDCNFFRLMKDVGITDENELKDMTRLRRPV